MSWGERSCKDFGMCVRKVKKCNVDCVDYEWDGVNNPDSRPARVDSVIVTVKRKNNVATRKEVVTN